MAYEITSMCPATGVKARFEVTDDTAKVRDERLPVAVWAALKYKPGDGVDGVEGLVCGAPRCTGPRTVAEVLANGAAFFGLTGHQKVAFVRFEFNGG